MITNLICRKLDKRMLGISNTLGFTYTRYADDMTFSANEYTNINKMLYWVKGITKDEGFILHPDKTRIMKKGSCQEVTGVVVNEKTSVNKKELKKFRALLYQIEQSGLEGKSWHGKSENLILVIWGYSNFIKMVDREKGAKYIAQVKAIMQKYPLDKSSSSTNEFRVKSANGKQPWEDKIIEDSIVTIQTSSVKKEEKVEITPSFVNNILNMFRK